MQGSVGPEKEATPRENPIRVVIGEDMYLMRQALESVVAELDGIEAAGIYGDRDSILAAVE